MDISPAIPSSAWHLLAEPLMPDGGTLLAMSYHGANKVVPNYNPMGPVKAALESAVRYLAFELGDKHIRVHTISPGPLKTRAASGLKDFDVLLSEAIERAPIGELVDIDDVGLTAAYLTTPFARRLTGTVTYVDGGLSIMARRVDAAGPIRSVSGRSLMEFVLSSLDRRVVVGALALLLASAAVAQAPDQPTTAPDRPAPRQPTLSRSSGRRRGNPSRTGTDADRKLREMDRKMNRVMRSICVGR